ncbi:MAG: flagellar biosynthetic protein FliO [Deltaproteobacteria bacterium]|nr:flagellar biosynthetic protein FliO [Deltaproteobacteria bacterium]
MSPEVTYVLESLGTIAVFGGALWIATVGFRRLAFERARGPLEILARQPLDGRRAIYLVRVGKRVLVVGASDGALTRLGSTTLEAVRGELAGPAEEAGPPPRRGFRDALARALGRDKT